MHIHIDSAAIETHVYKINNINGSLASLSGEPGFRNYVARRLNEYRVPGYIMRTAYNNAELVVRGTRNQIKSVTDFLNEMLMQQMIENCYNVYASVPILPINQSFIIIPSARKCFRNGEHSDKKLDDVEVLSQNSADNEVFRGAPSPHSSRSSSR